MIKKQLVKRITTAVVAGLLSVMMVMPVMAKGKQDDGLIHPWVQRVEHAKRLLIMQAL